MSLWDNFKKKIERTTSGLDFWDKEEKYGRVKIEYPQAKN